MFTAPLLVVLPFLYLTNLIETSSSQQPDFQQMFGSLLSGVQSALKEIQKPKGSGGNDSDDEDDEGGDGFAGIQKLMESIDTEKVGQFIQNFANPAKLMSWLPMKFQDYIPEGWREKIITIITSELDKLAAVWDALAKYKTLEHVWKALKRNTPTLASLLEDAWKIIKQRWAKFNGGLEPEAKEYMHNVKSSFGHWLSDKVLVPFKNLPPKTSTNVRNSLTKAFPAVEPYLTKLSESEVFSKWAADLAGEEEEELKKEKKEKDEEKKDGEGKKKEEVKSELSSYRKCLLAFCRLGVLSFSRFFGILKNLQNVIFNVYFEFWTRYQFYKSIFYLSHFLLKFVLTLYPDHNMVKYMSQAKVIFRKLNSPNTPQIQSITSGQYFFQYVIKFFWGDFGVG
ncbi:unnamed protein product [Meloidogyne enterolobii]|uniref:Uncharacterized protein n=1 Tax=Meloidogyne enterolobii TaxID=390850 RepID=A0ACB0Y7R0_MELEN